MFSRLKKLERVVDSLESSVSGEDIFDDDTEEIKILKDTKPKKRVTILSKDLRNILWGIIHISDVHYGKIDLGIIKLVTDSLLKKISKIIGKEKKNYLIIIMGDLLDKLTLNDQVKAEVLDFLRDLSRIATVIVVAGNHDYPRGNKDHVDFYEIFITQKRMDGVENIHYLKRAGSYQYDNILFGLTHAFSEKIFSIEGFDEGLLELMKDNYGKDFYKIGLYHGRESYAAKNQGQIGINKNSFEGYDLVLLGDKHSMNFPFGVKNIAFCGSLLQQTHDETPNNHGALHWILTKNMDKIQPKLIEIRNDYAIFKVKATDIDKIEPNKKSTIIVEIEHGTNEKSINKIDKKLKKKFPELTEVKFKFLRKEIKDDKKYKGKNTKNKQFIKDNMQDVLNTVNIIKFIAKRYLHRNVKDIKLLKECHKEITKKIDFYLLEGKKWELIEIYIEGFMCYQKPQIIKLKEINGGTIGIFGENGSGKTTVIDVILFMLFGYCGRIIGELKNDDSKIMLCKLKINIGKSEYLIVREQKNKRKTHRVKLFKDGNEIKSNKKGKTPNEVIDNKIIKLVGTYDNFLSTFVCSQLQDRTSKCILEATELYCENYIMQCLGYYDFFNECAILASIEKNKITHALKSINAIIRKTKLSKVELEEMREKEKFLNKEIEKLDDKQKRLICAYPDLEKNKINKNLKCCEKKLIKIKRSEKYNKVFEKAKEIKDFNNFKDANKLIVKYENGCKKLIEDPKLNHDKIIDYNKKIKILNKIIGIRLEMDTKITFLNKSLENINKYEKYLVVREKLDNLIKELGICQDKLKCYNNSGFLKGVKEKYNYNKLCERKRMFTLYHNFVHKEGALKYFISKIFLDGIIKKANENLKEFADFTLGVNYIISGNPKKDTIQKLAETNNELKFIIKRKDTKDKSLENSCGFDKAATNLVLRIAFSEEGNFSKPNFIFVDEAFVWFDKENKDNLSSFFKFIKEKFEHVFVISHDDHIKKLVDNSITINVDSNGKRKLKIKHKHKPKKKHNSKNSGKLNKNYKHKEKNSEEKSIKKYRKRKRSSKK